MFRFFAALALCIWGSTSALALPETAVVLNGIDNTASTARLDLNSSQLGVLTFPSFPALGTLEGNYVYVSLSGANEVRVYDAMNLAPVTTLPTGAGTNPYAVVGDGAGNVFVTLSETNELVRFDASGAETGRVSVGQWPQGLLFYGGQLFVANTGFRPSDFGYDPGTVSVVDPAAMTVSMTVSVGTNPQSLVGVGNEIHTICTGNYFSIFGEASVFDATTGAAITTVTLGGSPGASATNGTRVYTSDYFGGLYVYEAGSKAVVYDSGAPLAFGGSGYTGLAMDDQDNLYVTLFEDDLLVRMRTSDETITGTFSTGDGPSALVLLNEAPVPVALLAFDVVSATEGVSLSWSVADRENVIAFEVSRRVNQETAWTSLGQTPEMTFVDRNLVTGSATYRLAAFTREGYEVLSEREVTVGSQPAVLLAANPVRGSLELRQNLEEASYRLFDAQGRLQRGPIKARSGSVAMSVEGIAPGVYFLRVSGRVAANAQVTNETHRVVVLP